MNDAGWHLEHSYARLPEIFHERWAPVPVRAPRMVVFNRPLAKSLGLDAEVLDREESTGLFAGNQLPDGARPLALAYAGHQYGHFTKLGDGRGILLGGQITANGERFDIQLKGSGPTPAPPFSRGGDGRAALGPMLREYKDVAGIRKSRKNNPVKSRGGGLVQRRARLVSQYSQLHSIAHRPSNATEENDPNQDPRLNSEP